VSPHPLYADPTERAALFRLLATAFPRLPRRVEIAARLGWSWDEMTTPFVARVDGRLVTHVGVLDHPVRVAGRERRVAGIHAVCTEPAHRRRGHYRAAMEEALAFVDARWSAAKLHTDQPWLYEPFGFRVVPQHRFRLARSGGAGRGRAVGEADLATVHGLLDARAPVSNLFASRDRGWLFGIDVVLRTGGLGHLFLLDAPRLLVACEVEGGVLRVHDVVAAEVPGLDDVLAAAPAPFSAVELWMPADLLAPDAEPLPSADEDLLMVRGDWPDLPPFGVGWLASH
jgi:predicted N-acetyltransferase YhbS